MQKAMETGRPEVNFSVQDLQVTKPHVLFFQFVKFSKNCLENAMTYIQKTCSVNAMSLPSLPFFLNETYKLQMVSIL